MKVSIVSRVFPPETPTAAEEIKDIALYLHNKKHEVKIYTTFPTRPIGKVYSGFKRKYVTESREFNVTVYRTWHTVSKKSTYLSRLLENITFGVTSSRLFSRHEKPDIVYLMSWPLFAMKMLANVCVKYDVPYVVNIKDIYPNVLAESNRRKVLDPFFEYLRRMDYEIVNGSSKLIVISENMKQFYNQDRKINLDKIDVVYDWQDPSVIKTLNKINNFRKKLRVCQNDFLAVYAGNVGKPQGLEVFLDVAKSMVDQRNLKILIVGNGSCYDSLNQSVARLELKNIMMIDGLTRENVSEVQSAADLLLLPLRTGVGKFALPSKLISYMLSNRPILASIDDDSEAAWHIKRSGCGMIVPAMDSMRISKSLLFAMKNKEELEKMSRNARGYAISVFSKNNSLEKIENILIHSMGNRNEKKY